MNPTTSVFPTRAVGARRFDPLANWVLVKQLLSDPEIEVQWIFVKTELRELMLAAARNDGEDPALIERAQGVLSQPGDSLPHDDHLHLRIYCPGADRQYGCVDFGPVRWMKKHLKYFGTTSEDPPEQVAAVLSDLAVLP